ncbi:MAG: hypothetical protein WAO61_01440 [Solirubrobacterales bacterium]
MHPPVNPNEHDKFVLRQKWALVINRYYFSLDDESPPFCFVEQKRFKFKEDIRFFADETKTVELMRIKARQRFDPRATYDITDSNGAVIGQIQKQFGKSLLRSSYALFNPASSETVIVRERSLPIALFRRLVGFIPYVDDISNWLPIPYDFEFLRDGGLAGTHRRRRWKFTDIYDIDLSIDTGRTIDRRVVLAAAVGMDALQAR